MPRTKVKIECPKCGYLVDAEMSPKKWSFALFICPDCHSNVVHYDNKTDTISSELLSKIVKQKRIKLNCMYEIKSEKGKRQPISQEDVTGVSAILKDSSTVDDFLNKI